MIVTFEEIERFVGGDRFPSFIEGLIVTHSPRRICEVGPGANPALTPEKVQRHGLQYAGIDESEIETRKADMGKIFVHDLCVRNAEIPGAPYDMIISQSVAEHFRNSANAYENIFQSLAPNGLCVCVFPTLYTLPLLLNRLLPDSVSNYVLDRLSPRDRKKFDKFKAYYSRCRGPVRSQIRFFQQIGYEVLEYRGYFGHGYYQSKLPFLHFLEVKKAQLLMRMPIAYLTSCASVILKRPSCE
jgi:SAM-dependent methyltransferase